MEIVNLKTKNDIFMSKIMKPDLILLIDSGFQEDIVELANKNNIKYTYIPIYENNYISLNNILELLETKKSFKELKKIDEHLNSKLIDIYLEYICKINEYKFLNFMFKEDIWLYNYKKKDYEKMVNENIFFSELYNESYKNDKLYTNEEIDKYKEIKLIIDNWDDNKKDLKKSKISLKIFHPNIPFLIDIKNNKK